jgi:hypothetical protein
MNGSTSPLNDLVAGDRLYSQPRFDNLAGSSTNKVTAVSTTGAGTITLTGTGMGRTLANTPMQFWVAAPPANV